MSAKATAEFTLVKSQINKNKNKNQWNEVIFVFSSNSVQYTKNQYDR